MQIPILEPILLFESLRSHTHSGTDTPSAPSLPPGTSLTAHMPSEGSHSFDYEKATTGPKQACTTPRAISLAGKRATAIKYL